MGPLFVDLGMGQALAVAELPAAYRVQNTENECEPIKSLVGVKVSGETFGSRQMGVGEIGTAM
ncbi:MAG: hypothetical protein ABSD52_08935 [Candidatus Cybelea sp.]